MPVDLEHSALIRPNLNSIIYRYMDLEKFEYLLKDHSLFFCRSDKFSDPFEGSVPIQEVNYRFEVRKQPTFHSDQIMSDEDAQSRSKDLGLLHEKFRKSVIVNCWHINNEESDAMWRLYLKTNEGVAIQTTVSNLIESLRYCQEKIYMSKVRYINYANDIYYDPREYTCNGYNLFTPFVHKRTAFAHESELRLFHQIESAVDSLEFWKNQPNNIGQNLSCDLKKLIEKIILPPTADDTVKGKVKDLLLKYKINVDIEKSKLNDDPNY